MADGKLSQNEVDSLLIEAGVYGKKGGMKHFALRFIQIAWVAELIGVLVYTMFLIPFASLDRIELWLRFIPLFGALIGAQGIAASGGPLIADKIKTDGGGK